MAEVRIPQPVAAAVLAGGQGLRLGGRAKALLPLGPAGAPVLAATLEVLAPLADPIFVSAREPGNLASFGKPLVLDRRQGMGPLGALEAVLEASPHERVLVVACDMPFLSRRLLERLVALSQEHAGASAVVPRTAAGLHPLHAVYTRSLLPEIRERLERGALALHELLTAGGALEVAEDELRRYDPTLRSLENVNTPADLARARETRP
jgi:molybdopterin-guanine dinucleotide biosynthesis protein A